MPDYTHKNAPVIQKCPRRNKPAWAAADIQQHHRGRTPSESRTFHWELDSS